MTQCAVILKSHLEYLGGLERYAIIIAKALATRNYDVQILTTGKPIDVDGVMVHSLGKHPKSSLRSIPFFNKKATQWLAENSHDVIFGLDRNSFQTHYRAGNGLHKSYLKHRGSSILSWMNPKHLMILYLEKKLFLNPKLQRLFTNSQMVQQELIDMYQVPEEKIRVVHNGCNFEKFCLKDTCTPSLKEGKELLFIGNGYRRKGLPLILKALANMPSQKFHLSVIGKDSRVARYQRMTTQLGLSNQVTFHGPQANLLPFFEKADILVQPSQYDPFSNVVLEGLAMGLFVITTQTNGACEIIQTHTGEVIESPDDINALQEALLRALKKPQSMTTKRAIRDTVLHLDINSQINKILDLTIQKEACNAIS